MIVICVRSGNLNDGGCAMRLAGRVVRLLVTLVLIHATSVAQNPFYSQVSGNFNDRTNWNSQRDGSGFSPDDVPDWMASADPVVQFGHVMTTSAPASVGHLTVETGGSIVANHAMTMTNWAVSGSMDCGTQVITINGNMTVTGTLSAGSATIKFATGSAKAVNSGGWALDNVIIEGGGTVSLQANLTLNGDLSISSGTLAIGSNTLAVSGALTLSASSILTSTIGTISIGGDWVNDGVFTAGSGTVKFSGTTAQSIGGANSTEFFTLEIGNGVGVSLVQDITIDDTLRLKGGKIYAGVNKVVIGSTGGVSQTSGHIVGSLKKYMPAGVTAKLFEIGDSATYTPVSVQFSNVLVAGELEAAVFNEDHAEIGNSGLLSSKSVNRYWRLTNNGISFTNYGVNLQFSSADLDAGADADLLEVAKLHDGVWTLPTVGARGPQNIQVSGMTTLSDFVVAEPLPPPSVSSINPSQNAIGIARSTNIQAIFDQALNTATLTTSTVKVSSAERGPIAGSISYDSASKTLTFNPSSNFRYGEIVSITLTRGITGFFGDSLAQAVVWNFTVEADVASAVFAQKGATATGSQPRSVIAADFDNDGDLDLAMAAYGGTTVSIRLNDGTGSFSGSTEVSVQVNPHSVFAADFDGDGDMDLAAANIGSNTVSIRLNDGAGNFTGSTNVSVGTGPSSVSAADFDGDGDMDIAASNNNSNTVSIRLNDGSGNFSGSTNVSVGTNPISVFAADFDGDGDMDIAASNNNSNTVSIRLNDGAGNFSGSTNVSVGTNPFFVYVADFDGDGDMDLAAANYGSNTVSIRVNDGAANFSGSTNVSVGTNPFSVHAADFDGDGDMDIATANANSNTLSIRLNDGVGNFSGSTDLSAGSVPQGIDAADFDGDGDMDIVVTSVVSNIVTILRNQPGQPQNLLAIAGNSQASLSWNQVASRNFARYRIFGGTSSNPTTQVDSTTSGVTDTTKTVTGLTNGTVYYFRVAAVDNDGQAGDTSSQRIVVPAVQQGNALSYTSGSSQRVDVGDITTFDGLTAISYGGWIKPSSYGPGTTANDIRSVISKGAYGGTNTTFCSFFQGNGTGANFYSGIDAGTLTPVIVDATSIPLNEWTHFMVTWQSGSKINLYLNGMLTGQSASTLSGALIDVISTFQIGGSASADEDYFDGHLDEIQVWSRQLSQSEIQSMFVEPVGGDESGIIGLWHFDEPSGTVAYDATVQENNGTLVNAPARVSSGAMIPFAPENLVVSDSTNAQIVLTWNQNTEADFLRYRIYRDTSPEPTVLVDSTSTISDTSKTFAGLVDGTRYYFRITAVDTFGAESDFSGEVNAMFNDLPVPIQLAAFSVSATRLNAELRWRTETETENYGFEIERRIVQDPTFQVQGSLTLNIEPGTWNNIGFVRGSGTSTSPHEYSFSDRNLPSGRYAYRIKQVDRSGVFTYTSALEVEIGLAPRDLSLSEPYPNPFNPTTTIEFTLPEDGHVQLKIYDLSGREVATLVDEHRKAGVYQQALFDGSNLASGLYVVKLQFQNTWMTRKVMLIK
ncbi:MAG: VCBS repeat-containing protein [Ignavibacterium sp.]|jgi:chitodextrinase